MNQTRKSEAIYQLAQAKRHLALTCHSVHLSEDLSDIEVVIGDGASALPYVLEMLHRSVYRCIQAIEEQGLPE